MTRIMVPVNKKESEFKIRSLFLTAKRTKIVFQLHDPYRSVHMIPDNK